MRPPHPILWLGFFFVLLLVVMLLSWVFGGHGQKLEAQLLEHPLPVFGNRPTPTAQHPGEVRFLHPEGLSQLVLTDAQLGHAGLRGLDDFISHSGHILSPNEGYQKMKSLSVFDKLLKI